MRISNVFGIIALAFCAMVLTPPALAYDLDYSDAYYDCMNKANDAVFPTVACIQKETQRLDKVLKGVDASIVKALSEGQQKTFRAARGAWEKYRETYCAFLGDPSSGHIARIAGATCVLEMTVVHIEDLTAIAPPPEEKPTAKAPVKKSSAETLPPGLTAALRNEYRQYGGIAALANLCYNSELIPKAVNAKIDAVVSKTPAALSLANGLIEEYNAANEHAAMHGTIWVVSTQSYGKTAFACHNKDDAETIRSLEAIALKGLR